METAGWRSVTGLLAMMTAAGADGAEPSSTVHGPGTTLQTIGGAPGTVISFPPRFPAAARAAGQEDGNALLVVAIDAHGRVVDTATLAASHRAFGAAAEEAVRQWVFVAAAGDTLPRREVLEFEFRSKGTITVLSHVESARENVVPVDRAQVVRVVRWSELAPSPQRTAGAMPRLSEAARARLAGRPVLASFVIDADGAVHVPVVAADTDPEAAEAVLEALRGWRFTPPQHEGEPVVVQAERAFQAAGARP